MKFDFIQEEWEGLVGVLNSKDFTDAVESAAAEELIHAKKYVPELNQRMSGLNKVESVEDLLKDRNKFLYLATFYVCESMNLGAEAMGDGNAHVTIWVYNVPLFTTVVCLGIAATLYHLTGTLPLEVTIVCESERILEIFKEPAMAITDLFDLESVKLVVEDENSNSGEE